MLRFSLESHKKQILSGSCRSEGSRIRGPSASLGMTQEGDDTRKSSNRDPSSTQGKLRPASFLIIGCRGHPYSFHWPAVPTAHRVVAKRCAAQIFASSHCGCRGRSPCPRKRETHGGFHICHSL